ncbi:tRNA (N(6)-L-threonylcarbamoyladenosine(37)-C(2))-methylthiotransferase MtaB [Puia dinghuensis]|uniref:tRNA (N(6)-L-threonylcarbamoyladenosine(37)-C(2))-methylthiotransferase MtaB n=1 Tax=Puia dinghuensis TaxID=1792502 RepID=A0A8J2U611_9BACT|nr:tRNA (N(6)-L-threonylcarbamoyladenosine(37)-C(2))-methylthiotransferase MtaB [Puia dinghuensis]GGA81261.1 tRNA (N(6)-L-threonylcarbamoyladenosine(37)-C(2))-methylthiotransferase MtaB [Puia dinghuensis]
MDAVSAHKTVAFHTLGCKLNFSETSSISRLLEKEGFAKKEFDEVADVYVINTCSVTDNADKECRYLVRRIQRQAPGSAVVIMGCYAQLKPTEIAAIPGVDLVLGAAEKFNLAQHLRHLVPGDADKNSRAKICSCDIEAVTGFHPSFSLGDRTRTFLKVQDGCDYSCSFCTIPMARGASRSNTVAETVNTVQELAARGDVREIVLTGVNLGDFGKGPDAAGSSESFFHLMQALDDIEGIDRYRISSIEPNLLTPEMIDWVAASRRFMPHFHIPLQSGSNHILGLMRRRYKRELYAERVRRIKSVMPHCAIGVDVIVGFPGETADHFRETVDFLTELDVSYLHVFTYSERDKTKALELSPVIPVHDRNERNKFLRNLSYRKMQDFIRRHEGQTRKVLFEGHVKTPMMEGYTDNYIKITTPYREEWANRILDWTL